MQRWVHPGKGRYYQADLIEDLLGGWSVVMAWGGLDSHRGQMRTAWVQSYEDGIRLLEMIGKRRRQRGYSPVSDAVGEVGLRGCGVSTCA